MNFEEARAEYNRLRQAYDSRQLGPAEYTQRVQSLQVRDASGIYWAIDGATGGWLRYEGSSWVPAQPPVTGGYAPGGQAGGGYGAADATQVVAGQPAGGGYGPQPGAQGGYAPQGQTAPLPVSDAPAAAGPRPARRKGLIAGVLAVVAVLTLACIGGLIALAVSGALDRAVGITEVATASSLAGNNTPATRAGEFNVGNTLYVTYTAKRMKQGQRVSLKLFRNDAPFTTSEIVFEQDATYAGAFPYVPSQPGTYRAELYLDDQTVPSQTVGFTVR